jgi:hypothetical protein
LKNPVYLILLHVYSKHVFQYMSHLVRLVVLTKLYFISVLAASAGLATAPTQIANQACPRDGGQSVALAGLGIPGTLETATLTAPQTTGTTWNGQMSAAGASTSRSLGAAKFDKGTKIAQQLFPKSPYYENKYAHKAFNWLAMGLAAGAIAVSLVGLALGQTSFVVIAFGLIALALIFFFLNPQNREYHKKF